MAVAVECDPKGVLFSNFYSISLSYITLSLLSYRAGGQKYNNILMRWFRTKNWWQNGPGTQFTWFRRRNICQSLKITHKTRDSKGLKGNWALILEVRFGCKDLNTCVEGCLIRLCFGFMRGHKWPFSITFDWW